MILKSIVIIGAGISGLTAGIYALQSGFDVTIYESHTVPGGASTSWRRKGYLFEGGIHWMTGSSPKTPLNRLWYEVGALNDNVKVLYPDPFIAFDYNGQTAYIYRDIDKLRQHFLELSQEDRKEINRLCSDVKKFTRFTMPVMDIKGVKVKKKSDVPISSLIGMLPALPRLLFYNNQTAKEYSERFKSPQIKNLLENIAGRDNTAAAIVFILATLASGDGGYPGGGSLDMADRMAKYFEKLGGTIKYSKAVNKVLVENGIARGVKLDGEEIKADAVIVTLDTLVAIDTMFDTPISEPWAEKMRQTTKPMLDTFICLGVEADLSGLPERIVFRSDEPLVCGNLSESVIGICNYAGYKGYAPQGYTAVTSLIIGDSYDFWKTCYENGTYQAEKQKLAESLIEILAKKYPQTAGKIAVWDVATPLTYERYLGSYKGSWMSAMEKGSKNSTYPSKPESIQNVYFAGQRLMSPGGLPAALVTGRTAVQHLCKDTNTVFQANV